MHLKIKVNTLFYLSYSANEREFFYGFIKILYMPIHHLMDQTITLNLYLLIHRDLKLGFFAARFDELVSFCSSI